MSFADIKPLRFSVVTELEKCGVSTPLGPRQFSLYSKDRIGVLQNTENGIVLKEINLQNSTFVSRPMPNANHAMFAQDGATLAIRSINNMTCQIFDANAKIKLANLTTPNNEKVLFWEWLSENALLLVASANIYLWQRGSDSLGLLCPTSSQITDPQTFVAAANLDPSGKWVLVYGVRQAEGKLQGVGQLSQVGDSQIQQITLHAACFWLNMKNETIVTFFQNEKFVNLNLETKERTLGSLSTSSQFQDDVPVAVQMNRSLGLAGLFTRQGFFKLIHLESRVEIFSDRITNEPMFHSTLCAQFNSFLACGKSGKVLEISLDPSLPSYVSKKLDQHGLARYLADKMERLGFNLAPSAPPQEPTHPSTPTKQQQQQQQQQPQTPSNFGSSNNNENGAPSFEGQQNEGNLEFIDIKEYLRLDRIEELATVAAKKPAIRSPQNLQLILQHPLKLKYFATLMQNSALNEFESIQVVSLVLEQNRLELVEKWIRADLLENSEELGDILKSHNGAMVALSVYVRSKSHHKAIALMCQLTPERVSQYVEKMLQTQAQSKINYTGILNGIPQKELAEEVASILVKAGVISIDEVCTIFLHKNAVRQLTALYLQLHSEGRHQSAAVETVILVENLRMAPHVADAIFTRGLFSLFERSLVCDACERAGLIDRAVSISTDEANTARLIQHYAYMLNDLPAAFARLSTPELVRETVLALVGSGHYLDLPAVFAKAKQLISFEDLIGPVQQAPLRRKTMLVHLLDAFPEQVAQFMKEQDQPTIRTYLEEVQAMLESQHDALAQLVGNTKFGPSIDPEIVILVCKNAWLNGQVEKACEILRARSLTPPLLGFVREMMGKAPLHCVPVGDLLVHHFKSASEDTVQFLFHNPTLHAALFALIRNNGDAALPLLLELEPDLPFLRILCDRCGPFLSDSANKILRAYKQRLQEAQPPDSSDRSIFNALVQAKLWVTLIRVARDRNWWENVLRESRDLWAHLFQIGCQRSQFHTFSSDQFSLFCKALLDTNNKQYLVKILEHLMFTPSFPLKKNKSFGNLLVKLAIECEHSNLEKFISELSIDHLKVARHLQENGRAELAIFTLRQGKFYLEASRLLAQMPNSAAQLLEIAKLADSPATWRFLGRHFPNTSMSSADLGKTTWQAQDQEKTNDEPEVSILPPEQFEQFDSEFEASPPPSFAKQQESAQPQDVVLTMMKDPQLFKFGDSPPQTKKHGQQEQNQFEKQQKEEQDQSQQINQEETPQVNQEIHQINQEKTPQSNQEKTPQSNQEKTQQSNQEKTQQSNQEETQQINQQEGNQSKQNQCEENQHSSEGGQLEQLEQQKKEQPFQQQTELVEQQKNQKVSQPGPASPEQPPRAVQPALQETQEEVFRFGKHDAQEQPQSSSAALAPHNERNFNDFFNPMGTIDFDSPEKAEAPPHAKPTEFENPRIVSDSSSDSSNEDREEHHQQSPFDIPQSTQTSNLKSSFSNVFDDPFGASPPQSSPSHLQNAFDAFSDPFADPRASQEKMKDQREYSQDTNQTIDFSPRPQRNSAESKIEAMTPEKLEALFQSNYED